MKVGNPEKEPKRGDQCEKAGDRLPRLLRLADSAEEQGSRQCRTALQEVT